MLNRTLIKQFLPITVLALVLIVAYWLDLGSSKTPSKHCRLDSRVCEIQIGPKQTLTVQFNAFPLAIEEQLDVSFSLPNTFSLKSAWIEGVNMFMGKMRVIVEHTDVLETHTEISAISFLGACSEPNMRWRMIIELENKEEGAVQPNKQRYFVNFATSM